MHNRLAVAYLALAALIYASIGISGLVAPDWLMSLVAIELPDATAINEIRAAYGGQMLALSAAMLAGATRPSLRRAALTLFVAAVTGMVVARLLSVALDGPPGLPAWILLALETSGIAAGVGLILSWPKSATAD